MTEATPEQPQNKRLILVGIGIMILLGIFFGKGSSSSSSGSSNNLHTCLTCGNSYSGYGWSTINGEEYALDKDQGNQYCSSACAKASRPARWR